MDWLWRRVKLPSRPINKMSACNWKLYNDFIKFIYIIPSLLKFFFNFGGKTVSQLEAKNFLWGKIFFSSQEIWGKNFFQAKKFEAKIFFKPKNFSLAEKLTHVRKVNHWVWWLSLSLFDRAKDYVEAEDWTLLIFPSYHH